MLRQSDKPQTIKTTNPQSSRLAGFTDTTLEDASAWNTVDGVKQDRGWAYADGSTLVNTSGKYDSYLARTGSLVLPSGPFRTELMDLSSYITHSESWDSYSAEGYFSSDLSGQWFLEVQVKGSGNDDRVIASSSLTFTNIFVQTSPSNESVGAAAGQTSSRSIPVQAYISSSSSIVFRAGPNGVADTARYFNVFGKIKLSGKPTIPSFDTFLLDYPVVQLYDSIAAGALGLPEASDTQSGIVSTGAQTFAGDKTFTGNIDADSYTGLPAATPTADGVVKKNRWGKQELGAPVTTNATSFLQFDNLTAGQLYRFSGHVAIHRSSGSDNSTSLVRARGTALDTNYWVAVLDPASVDEVPTTTYSAFSIIFEAAASGSIYLETFSFSAGIQVVDVVSLLPATWAQLEELNNYDDTNLGNDFS
jgi:hypothetical protein